MFFGLLSSAAYSFNINAVPTFATAVATLLLGVVVFVHEKASLEGLLLFLITFTVGLWLFAFSCLYCSTNEITALAWVHVAYLGLLFLPSAIYHFTTVVLRIDLRCGKWIRTAWAVSFLLLANMLINGQFIAGLYHYWWGYYPKYGLWSAAFLVFFFLMMAASLRHFWVEYRHSGESTHKKRIHLFMAAFAVASLGSLDYLPKYGIEIYPFGYLFVFIAVGMLAITVWRYRLTDLTPAFAATKVLETMDGAVFVTDQQGFVRVVNRAGFEMLGYSEEELVGKPLPFGPSLNSEFRNKAMNWTRKDGLTIEVSVSSAALEDKKSLAGYVYVVLDVTEKKRAGQALQESEQRLQEILDNSMTVIYLKDTLGRFILVNRRFETLFHVDREELIGKTDYDVFPRDIADTFRDNDHRVLKNNTSLLAEEVSPHDDGAHTYVSIKFPVHDAAGQVSGVCGIATDITIRKLAEELLKESEEKFRSVAQTASDAIVMADDSGKIIFWNKSAQKIFGYTETEIIEKSLTTLMPERYHAQHLAGFDQYRATGESKVIGRSVEMHGLRKNGTEFPLELSLSAWATSKGRFFSGIIRDIGERKRAQEKLMEKTFELAHANAEREQLELFTYVASHDLREPLQKIIGFGDLLAASSANALDDKGKEYLQRMQAATMRIEQLINDLLRFSRVTTEKTAPAAVPLSETMQDVLSDLELRIKALDATITIGEMPTIYADKVQMGHVFQNLISNALKFTKKGEKPYITVKSRLLEDDKAEISVTDHGIGFEETYLDRIFKPFERLHSRSEYEGSGLGLAICQKVVNRLGGTITAKSSPGHGATFIVTMPTKDVS